MPTVDTAFAQPAPPVSVTSPDGLLTATVDAANGGVLLFADFAGTPEQVVATNLFPDPAMTRGAAAPWLMTGGTVANGPEGGIKTTATGTGYVIATDTATADMPSGLSGASNLYVSMDVRVTGTTGFYPQMQQRDSTGAVIGNTGAAAQTATPGSWKRCTFVLPLAANTAKMGQIQLIRASGATVGDTTEWRNLRASTVADGPFFTGSTASDGTYSYRWTGTPNASTSQKYIPGVAAVVADKVRFYRGDGTLVRSGDPAWAPGGTAVAYDHEAPVGGSVAYYAVPETLSGAQGAATATLGIPNPWTGDSSDVWIKSPTNPGASIRVQAAAFEETARPLRTSMAPISGATLGISSYDVTGGLTGTLTVYTDGKAEYDAMLALLDGSPLLIQSDPERAGIPLQWYAQPVGDALSLRRVETGTGWDMRSWPLQLQEVRRPATLDAPLMIPGNSYDTPPYVSYDAAKATGLSYNALLGVG